MRPFQVTGPVIKMATAMVADSDVLGFLCVTCVLLLGFSVAFAVCMPLSGFGLNAEGTGGYAQGILVVFASMLGAFELESYPHPVAIVMFVMFAFVMALVLLNLLIAMMSHTYEEIKSQATVELQILRAQIIMDIERKQALELKFGCKNWSEAEFSERFPRYLQVLTKQDPPPPARYGESHEQNARKMEIDMKEMKEGMAEMKEGMAEVMTMLRKLNENSVQR